MTTLTPRQLEILRLSAEGFSGPQIAVRLHVTIATVNEHRTRIRNRLGASTAAHAVAIAYQRGILQGFDGTDVLRQLDSARAWAVHWQQEADQADKIRRETASGAIEVARENDCLVRFRREHEGVWCKNGHHTRIDDLLGDPNDENWRCAHCDARQERDTLSGTSTRVDAASLWPN